MSDEPLKWMFSISLDNFMGFNITWVFRQVWRRWYWRRPFEIELMRLDDY